MYVLFIFLNTTIRQADHRRRTVQILPGLLTIHSDRNVQNCIYINAELFF